MIQQSNFSKIMQRLSCEVASDLQQMENMILSEGADSSRLELVSGVINHLLNAGGKRIRPSLVLLICRMLNCKHNNRLQVAGAIEAIHNATLLHDEVIDESSVRRGAATANSIWDNKSSVLVGDLLLTTAFQWLISCGHEVLSIFAKASYIMISGEIKQMVSSQVINLSESEYISIIFAKTATLFAAGCESAAVISGASKIQQIALRNFGQNFGTAFQITDDTLDYVAGTENFGKEIGTDFRTGKVTLPVIISYSKADYEERVFWENRCKDSSFEQALSYLMQHNAIAKSLHRASSYIEQAIQSLSPLPSSQYKDLLINLANALQQRNF